MVTSRDWVKVELRSDEDREAHRIARARRGEAASGGYRRTIEGTIAEDLRGARGELAVARWLGIRHPGWGGDVSWKADINRGADIGDLQVRTAAGRGYGLALDAPPRPRNTGCHVLVLAHDAPVMWIAGWIDAEDGYAAGTLRHDGTGQPDWYRVAQSALRPMTALTTRNRPAASPRANSRAVLLPDPEALWWCETCHGRHRIAEMGACRGTRAA